MALARNANLKSPVCGVDKARMESLQTQLAIVLILFSACTEQEPSVPIPADAYLYNSYQQSGEPAAVGWVSLDVTSPD